MAVKEEEWQRRTSKVMNQARPQLGVVRGLFDEGRELGYEQVVGERHKMRNSFFLMFLFFCVAYFFRPLICFCILLFVYVC